MSSKTHKIGLMLCSTRTPRSAPQLASFILSLLPPSPVYDIQTIDLLDWDLPLHTTEPTVPTRLDPASLPEAYSDAITRAWSAHIASFDAFIFLCPQYNWGYPAAVKNAIDYLFHEWTQKPAMVVSYGGRGGGLGADQLVQVLKGGLRMRVVEEPRVALAFRDGADWGMQDRAEKGLLKVEDLLADRQLWAEQKAALVQAFNRLLALLE